MQIGHYLICFVLTAALVVAAHVVSAKRLSTIEFLRSQPTTLRVFLYARIIYWYIFAILISAFLLGMSLFSTDGNLTRQIIAYRSFGKDNVPTLVIEQMSTVFLPLIFLTLFTSMIALAVLGRNVLRQMPTDEKPDERFTRFRFTFVLMALSLVLPPLAFGSLLLL
ncbi:MAG: hypothetical protein JSS75_05570 [Bacteroidetes bacterium]|nr:hypothetical protein [Bacteroidota bacterium]